MSRPPIAETLKTYHAQPIDLFELDISVLVPPGSPDQRLYHFTNWTEDGQPVVFRGIEYTPIPLESKGFEQGGSSQLGRPTITVSNVGLAITQLSNTYSDLVGATVRRTRTLTTYLDGQPSADPEAYWGPDIYVVEQKASENKLVVQYQLAVPFDLEGCTLPARRLLREQCSWVYRSGIGCSYTGTQYWDANDQPVATAAQDVCGKRLTSCRLRFAGEPGLPFGGFPGLVDKQG
jgi:lambda family phage minor tail protein L